MAEDEIDADIRAFQKEYNRDEEIERIYNEFRLDAYAVMGLMPGVPESDIRKKYKQLSLLIHPDKAKHPLANDSFDRLKKAHEELLDEKTRERLDESIADARMLTMRDMKLTRDDEEVKSEEFAKAWREKTKWVIMDNEKRRQRKMQAQMREEGREQRKADEEAQERKRKREHEEAWEKTRDERINSWRDFKKGGAEGAKKKKKKIKTLG